jgi:hypothetical protein
MTDSAQDRNPLARISVARSSLKRGRSAAAAHPISAAPIDLRGEAAEVALGEAQAVLAMVQDEERRARLADLVAAVSEGELSNDDADALAELLELGLQTGRLRAVYGPGGEQAALRTFRQLPRGKELADSAREVGGALASLVGRPLEKVQLQATGPGAFLLTISADGLELSVRLDRQGARLASVGI